MTVSPLQHNIFRLLKTTPGPESYSLVAISTALNEAPEECLAALTDLVQQEWVLEENGKYRIGIWLDPPLTQEDRAVKIRSAWEYSHIRARALYPETGVPFVQPFHKYLPHGWSQNGRGTCTGHSGAIMMQMNYYACTNDFPTDEEMRNRAFNQQKTIGACTMTYDQWYRTVFSAQWCYHIGRLEGNVQYPSGGFTKSVMAAMVKYGGVPWDTCLTPKTSTCAPLTYPLSFDETKAAAEPHRLEGYAVVTSFEAVMDAIENSAAHVVNMATNLEEDYKHPAGGNVWRAHVGAPKAGSHALPWVFVDRAKGLVGCWNSWGSEETGGFAQTCWIDKRFWQENCSPGYVPLDREEAKIGRDLYVKTLLTANVSCKYIVADKGGETAYTGDTTVYLEKGVEYTIQAVPSVETVEGPQVRTVSPQGDVVVLTCSFVFTAKSDPPVPPDPEQPAWIANLIAFLKKMWGR